MQSMCKRFLSVALTLAMLAAMVCGVLVPAMAAENQQYTLFFENSDNWAQVYVYYWSDENIGMVEWPGEPAEVDDGQLYRAAIPGEAQYVIFNNAEGAQTDDLTIPGDNYVYSLAKNTWHIHADCDHAWKESVVKEPSCSETGVKEYACEKCNASYQVKLPALDHDYTDGACSVCGKEAPATQTIYFDNTEDWTEVNAYYWCDAPQDDGTLWPAWPGVAMTLVEDRLYSVEIPAAAEYIIFNNGTEQTDDLWIPGPDQVYSFTTGLWEEIGGCVHQWNEGLVIWPLTCTQDGVTLFSCVLCGDTYEDYRYATGHSFEEGVCVKCGEAQPDDVNVYFDNAKGWEEVYIYFWSDSNIGLSTWPGVAMTELDGGYTAQISGEAEYVIFNSGAGREQSPDMWLPGDGFMFCMFSMEWKEFTGCFHSWQQTESENYPTCNNSGFEAYICESCGVPCSKYVEALGHAYEDGFCLRCGADMNAKSKVYFDNAKNWESVYIYFWSDNDIEMTVWPGVEMTAEDGGYSAEVPAAAQYVIFSDGTSDNQTTDMWLPGDGWFYSMFIDDWAEFDGCFHDWVWNGWIYEPSCVEFGFSLYSCRDCAQSCGRYATSLGHDFADGLCQRCGYAQPELYTLYFDNTDGWENVYVYYWPDYNAGYDTNWYFPEWPGDKMTHVKGTIYSVQIPVYGTELNFSDGNSVVSDDLTAPGDGYMYSWELGAWTEMIASQGATVSGTVTSYLDDAAEVTVVLSNETGSIDTVVTGNQASFTLENVDAGTYTLTVSKAGHMTRTYTVTVEAEDVTVDAKICPKGDTTADGKVNIGDTARAYNHAKGGTQLEAYAFACADSNGDGYLTIGEVARIYAHVKGTKLLW